MRRSCISRARIIGEAGAVTFKWKLLFLLYKKCLPQSSKLSHYRVLEDLHGFDKMSEQKTPTNNGVPITNARNYHWWYDAKSAGVSNSPPANYGRSPPNATSFMSTSPTGSSFMSTSPSSVTGINLSEKKRRDSLKNMYHLCDFATPK